MRIGIVHHKSDHKSIVLPTADRNRGDDHGWTLVRSLQPVGLLIDVILPGDGQFSNDHNPASFGPHNKKYGPILDLF